MHALDSKARYAGRIYLTYSMCGAALGFIAMVVLLATVLSCCFKWLPILNQISSGWVIIICAVVVSAYAAARYPIDDEPAPEKAGGTG